jgi:hypothetical protein
VLLAAMFIHCLLCQKTKSAVLFVDHKGIDQLSDNGVDER